MSLALSKTCDPADFALLPKELKIVDQHFTTESPQHPLRRWEYALAIDAFWCWQTQCGPSALVWADVGGAGSPFGKMIAGAADLISPVVSKSAVMIDPSINEDLASHLASVPSLRNVVFCLSVLEHVDDLDRFCYHLSCLVAPGGLLVLTMDYCQSEDPWPTDDYHFSWMRKRIFGPVSIARLLGTFKRRDLTLFGTADYTWHGPQVFDYSFASLVLVKRA